MMKTGRKIAKLRGRVGIEEVRAVIVSVAILNTWRMSE